MIKGYLIDLDGTIYIGKTLLPGAKDFIAALQDKQIPFLFVTNNSTKLPQEVCSHLATSFDIHVSIANVYTSGMASVDYLIDKQFEKNGYVIGEPALRQIVQDNGFTIDDKTPSFVLQGLDRQVDYTQLANASLAIQNGATHIVTNSDKQYPVENGFIPGSGAITDLLVASTRKQPVIIGKPSDIIMNYALKRIGLAREDVIMVGDNYHTDILAGIDNGIATLLTLTGVTQASDVPHLPKQPNYIVNNLTEWKV